MKKKKIYVCDILQKIAPRGREIERATNARARAGEQNPKNRDRWKTETETENTNTDE
jgi:hypothetical protein